MKKLKLIFTMIYSFIPEILALTGVTIILKTTYDINRYCGLFAIGGFFIFLSYFFYRSLPPVKRR